MKILLYQKEDMHTEVMGFFLHYYKDCTIHICHRHVDSSFNWVSTFEKAIGVTCSYISKPIFTAYDKIIFITSRNLADLVDRGKMEGVDPAKVLQIRHTYTDKWSEGHPNISLTSLIPAAQGNLLTTFPQLRRRVDEIPDVAPWVFTVVGLSDYSYPKKDVQDLQRFIAVMDKIGHAYRIQIITRKGKKVESALSHPRVKFLYNLSSAETGQAIKNSHYLLPLPKKGGAYYSNLMTGIIPLALSYGIPMLAQENYFSIYRLQHQAVVQDSLAEYAWKLQDKEWYLQVATECIIDADAQQKDASAALDRVNQGLLLNTGIPL